jgi:ATP-dependent DNA helicase RecQ
VHTGATLERGLSVLVTNLFAHLGFRPGQATSVRQVLGGGDCLVLLPTGAGKSLVYQLAGLVRPGMAVVIDPIVALIDDQAPRLGDDGIDRVEAIHRDRLDGQMFARLAAGEALFGLCTPERFQTARFREHLGQAAEAHLVNLQRPQRLCRRWTRVLVSPA